MSTQRVIALILAAAWTLAALLTENDASNSTAMVVANIWLAAVLLARSRR